MIAMSLIRYARSQDHQQKNMQMINFVRPMCKKWIPVLHGHRKIKNKNKFGKPE